MDERYLYAVMYNAGWRNYRPGRWALAGNPDSPVCETLEIAFSKMSPQFREAASRKETVWQNFMTTACVALEAREMRSDVRSTNRALLEVIAIALINAT